MSTPSQPDARKQAIRLRNQGILAIRAGDTAQGRAFLFQSIELYATDATAWLWLSGAVTSHAERRFCLEQTLALQPDHPVAQRGLAELPDIPSVSPFAVSSAPPSPEPVPDAPPPFEDIASPASVEQAEPAVASMLDALDVSDPLIAEPVISAPALLSPELPPAVTPTPDETAHPATGKQAEPVVASTLEALDVPETTVDDPELPQAQETPQRSLVSRKFLAIGLALGIIAVALVGITMNGINNGTANVASIVETTAAPLDMQPTMTAATAQPSPAATARPTSAGTASPEPVSPSPFATTTAPALEQRSDAPPDTVTPTSEAERRAEPDETPTSAAALTMRGLERERRDSDDEGALSDYTAAIEADPSYADAYFYRGDLLMKLGKIEEGSADHQQAIQLDPNPVKVLFHQGRTQANLGDPAAAIAKFTQVIRLDSTFAQAYYARGERYAEQGDMQAAIRDYTEFIEAQPDLPEGYAQRGRAYIQLDDIDAAIADWEMAGALYQQLGLMQENDAIQRLIQQWE
jgi:Tfp pilus assembly protein PilF